MSPLVRFALAALLALFTLPAAAVQPTGSAAWVDEGGAWVPNESRLYHGPGYEYGVIGAVGGGARIRVDRCSRNWCQIHAPNLKGWMLLGNIDFGTGPWSWHDKTDRFPIQYGGPVCFYSGANFTGEQTCFKGITRVKDLALSGLDNSFSSVRVGSGSVMACRDRNYRSYCVILNKDIRNLEGLLNNAISSIEVY